MNCQEVKYLLAFLWTFLCSAQKLLKHSCKVRRSVFSFNPIILWMAKTLWSFWPFWEQHSVRKTFLASSKYLLPYINVGSETNIPNSKNWWHITAHLPFVQVVVRFKTKQRHWQCLWPYRIMFSLTSSQVIFKEKSASTFQKVLWQQNSDSNFLLLTFSIGSKRDFQVANLPLASVNPATR